MITDNPYRPASSSPSANAQQLELRKTSVLLVILLLYVTGRYFVPYWYVSRRRAFNSLAGYDAIRLWPCILGFVLQTLNLTLLSAGAPSPKGDGFAGD